MEKTARHGKPLTALEVTNLNSRGRHAAGKVAGLYLNIGKTGGKSWTFLYQRYGKQREIGLGPFPLVSLVEARQKALEHRQRIFRGEMPLSAKQAAQKAVQAQNLTFAAGVEAFLVKNQKVWENNTFQHTKNILNLERRAPDLRLRPLSSITRADILKIAERMTPSVMNLALIYLHQLFQSAIIDENHGGPNPVDKPWILEKAGKAQVARKPHPSMAWREVPAYFASLQALPLVESLALQFQILTAVRPSESRKAAWDEIDDPSLSPQGSALWTVPAARMKAKKVRKKIHRVPLSRQALDLLSQLKILFPGSPWLFPNRRSGVIGADKLRALLPQGVTLHGFRSSFRSWIGDDSERFSPDVAEMAIAHTVGGEVERVYRQGDQLHKRRPLMQAWADFLTGAAS